MLGRSSTMVHSVRISHSIGTIIFISVHFLPNIFNYLYALANKNKAFINSSLSYKIVMRECD